MICRSLDYYMLVMCFVVTIPQRCTTELLPPPFNLSYEWTDPFNIRLTWQAHPNCSLKYVLHEPNNIKKTIPRNHRDTDVLVTDLNTDATLTLKTTGSTWTSWCPYGASNMVIPRQVPLVTDFKFFLYPPCDGRSSQTSLCGRQATWTPGNETSGLSVFYKLCDRASAKLSPCQVFNSGGLRQGCHLTSPQKEKKDKVCILFRVMVDGRAVNQTFALIPHDHIRTLPPNVSVSEQGGYLKISWQHANNCPELWKYTVSYSECGRAKVVTSGLGKDHQLLPFNEACRYKIQVQPLVEASCGVAQADRSVLLVYNDGATQDHSMMVVCVAVPSLLSVLVVALCYYVRRKRNTFFKKIPVPPSSLKEMMSSIHQSQQLFVPVREKVDVCSVSPVSPVPPELHTLMWEVP